jgi:hypothetical protein
LSLFGDFKRFGILNCYFSLILNWSFTKNDRKLTEIENLALQSAFAVLNPPPPHPDLVFR